MKAYLKHILTICLVFLTAATFVVPLILLIQQQVIIHEMKEKLEKESLQSIRIEHDKVIWTKAGKECIINGRMFDVKSFENDGRYSILTGLFDDEETGIVRHLTNTAADSGKENNRARIIFGFTHLQAVENPGPVLNSCISLSAREFPQASPGKLLIAHASLHSPPPDHLLASPGFY